MCLEYEQAYLEERERDGTMRSYFAALYDQLTTTEEHQHQQAVEMKELARSITRTGVSPKGESAAALGSASGDRQLSKQTSTALEVAKALAATPEAVDALAQLQEQQVAVREARMLVVKLQQELATWQVQRQERAAG